MNINETIHGFLLKEKKFISEIKGEVYIFEHLKTKAQLLYIKNDDDNKVFCATFATYPCDSCGTAHIIEHSVLCGSDKYPLKDPFVKLLNSSMNTFLNAMTFMDKTMYPVASRNEKDFENLVDVYCDAVFNPLIKHDYFAFRQEGWHFELNNEDELEINGIVYNEMKGVYSDPEEVLSETVGSALFPDTVYSKDSGGDPDVIPELTYENYLRFYNTHYHPSNSFLFFYGDTDIEKHLKKLNDDYLSKYERIERPIARLYQTPFDKPVFCSKEYDAEDDDSIETSFYFAKAYAMTEAGNMKDIYALNVLIKILFDTDSSPLKKALTDLGIASETVCDFTTCVRQPYFTIAAKNAKKETLSIFEETIDKTLKSLVANGIDKDLIKASLNNFEFDLREADSGNYPKGVVDIIHIMESWLYGEDPFGQLEYESVLKYLRENETSEFYTGLIEKFLLSNTHSCTVVLEPKVGLSEEKNSKLKTELQKFKKSLSDDELLKMKRESEILKERQNTPDSAENIAKIPVLPISEISPLPERFELSCEQVGQSRIFIHEDSCSGIIYVDFGFDLSVIAPEDLCVLELLTETVGTYATEEYSEYELANEIGIYLGDTDLNVNLHQNIKNLQKFEKRFVYFAKALSSNAEKLFDIAKEVLLNTNFDSTKRLLSTVNEEISKFEYELVSGAEQYAALRMGSMLSPRGAYKNKVKGVGYYNFLLKTKAELESGNSSVLTLLKNILAEIVNTNGLDILITCDKEVSGKMRSLAINFINSLPCSCAPRENIQIEMNPLRHEGIIIPSNVCYTSVGINLKNVGLEMPLGFSLCKKYLKTNYLWENIRVKGGAYGAIMSADRGGDVMLISYRDPNVEQTYKVYDNIANELRNLKLTEKEIHDVIIGTAGELDSPMQPYSRGRKALYNIYFDNSFEDECKVRDSILSAVPGKLNECAYVFEALKEKGVRVTLASRNKLNEATDRFDQIYSIKQGNSQK